MSMSETKAWTMYDIAVYKATGNKPERRYLTEEEAKRKQAKKNIEETHVHHPRQGWITKEKAKKIGFIGVDYARKSR